MAARLKPFAVTLFLDQGSHLMMRGLSVGVGGCGFCGVLLCRWWRMLLRGLCRLGSVFSVRVLVAGQLSNPQRAAVRASTGQLFVADRDNDRVEIFDTATNTVVGQFGDVTTIDDPFGVAVDQATGDVYVSSTGSGTITKWSDSGLGYVRDVLFVSPAPVGDPAVAGQLGSFAAPLAVAPSSGDLLVGDPGTRLLMSMTRRGFFSRRSMVMVRRVLRCSRV